MFERDYLMRLIMAFFQGLTRSIEKAKEDKDPREAANMLDEAISQATEIDGATLLSLEPESMAGVLQVSGVDPRVATYIGRSLQLSSQYLAEAGDGELSALRLRQAQGLAAAYGFTLSENPEDLSDLPQDNY